MHAGSTALLLTVPLKSSTADQYGGGGEVGSGGGDVSQGLSVAVPPLVAAAFLHLMAQEAGGTNEDAAHSARLDSASSGQGSSEPLERKRADWDSDGTRERQGDSPGVVSATDATSRTTDRAATDGPTDGLTDGPTDHVTDAPMATLSFREALQRRMAIHFHAHDCETLKIDAESLDHAWSKLKAVGSPRPRPRP